jgi:hypothetical protein
MAGGPEDHVSDSRELYVLAEGDEWAHMEALDPDAGYWARRFAQLVNWRARGEKAVVEPIQPPPGAMTIAEATLILEAPPLPHTAAREAVLSSPRRTSERCHWSRRRAPNLDAKPARRNGRRSRAGVTATRYRCSRKGAVTRGTAWPRDGRLLRMERGSATRRPRWAPSPLPPRESTIGSRRERRRCGRPEGTRPGRLRQFDDAREGAGAGVPRSNG